MRIRREPAIQIKTAAQLAAMAEAGQVVAHALSAAAAAVAPGVSTAELDAIAAREIREAGAAPSFLGYHGFPATICACINDEIVHGMPSAKRVLRKGDILSIDTGVELDGYYGDSALTVPIGEVNDEARRLMKVTEESLELAIDKVREGNRLFDICGTVEDHVTGNGFSIVREYVGHGIGTQLHEDPQVPNYVDRRNENPRLREGMVLAIEPMVNAGKPEAKVLRDKWTAVAKDGSYSAHFEHCVAVTANGPWVLTRP